MNTGGARDADRKGEDGEYKIPFLVVCDAFQSEMVAFADLVLPDTTYLERHDVMSMLDRPISRVRRARRFGARAGAAAAGPVQAVPGGADRAGVAPEVSGLHHAEGGAQVHATTRTSSSTSRRRQPGIGFLMGWRGKDGNQHLRGEPNPKQWEMYAENNCVFQYHMPPEHCSTCATGTAPTCDFAQRTRAGAKNDPIAAGASIRSHAELPPRRAGQDARGASRPSTCASASTPTSTRCPSGIRRWRRRPPTCAGLSAGRGHAAADGDVPLLGLAERLAAPDPQPQLPARQPGDRAGRGHRRRRLVLGREPVGQGALHAAATARRWSRARCGPGTRSARPTAPGACRAGADESRKGFLLNHLITEELPP